MEELIVEKYIFVDQDYVNQVELFETIGTLLINDGLVKPSFIDALVQREAVYPTGLPTKHLKIAIPHTDGNYVNKPCIVVAKLKNPIEFNEMGNNQAVIPINLVIMLVINDGKKHLDTLQKIIAIISDDDILVELKHAQTSEKIYQIITKALS